MEDDHIDNESLQKFQAEETDGSDPSQSSIAPSETPELQSLNQIVLNAPQNIGNWCDLVDTTETTEYNGTDNDAQYTVTATIYQYNKDIQIALASDLMICQLPTDPPYQVLAYGISDNVIESELYMLFGGHLTIAGHIYRSDLREMLMRAHNYESMVYILMKQSMLFKGCPLKLAVVYVDQQIYALENHHRSHKNPDFYMSSFDEAYQRYVEYSNSPVGDSIKPFRKPISNDIRTSMNFHSFGRTLQTVPENAVAQSRTEPNNSFNRHQPVTSGYNRFVIQQHQQQPKSIAVPTTTATILSKPKISPFGDAKPVDTSQKVLQLMKNKEQQNKQVNATGDASPNYLQQQKHEIDPTQIKIQKRPDSMKPNGAITGSNTQQSQYGVPYRTVFQSKPMNIMNETIDVSKPPPPLPPNIGQRQKTQQGTLKDEITPSSSETKTVHDRSEEDGKNKNKTTQDHKSYDKNKNFQERDGHKRESFKRDFHKYEKHNDGHRNDHRRQNIKKESYRYDKNDNRSQRSHKSNYSGKGGQQQQNQTLPPSGFNARRKSSTEKTAQPTSSTPVEKSQSAPLSQEGDTTQQSSRSSPSGQSLKRPNSANSSMSFVTALSGSEMSTISTELTCVPGSTDSISDKPSGMEDQRRHSWEGEKGDKNKTVYSRKKGYEKKNNRKYSSNSRGHSRNSSASTLQYQSASSVFLDGSESSKSTLKSVSIVDEKTGSQTPEMKPITKTKNIHEKRAPSLPISRSHVAPTEKETEQSKDFKNKTDSLSAPPTPLGPSKKRNKKNKPNYSLQNNKFRVLADSEMNDQ